MKISGQIKNIHIPPSVRWDMLFLPALFLFNCFTFSSWWPLSKFAASPWMSLAWLYGLAILVPLVWRDKAPLTVFATQCALTAAAWPFFHLYTPIAGIPVALYTVSVHRNKRISLLALLTSLIPNGLAAAVAFKVYDTPDKEISSFVQNSLFLVLAAGGAWALGRGIQASKRRVQHLEREQKTAQEAVTEERRRIAAELHDIVCHAVTLIILQAAGAARVAKTDLAEVIQALTNIESKGTQAMAELQRLLGVLRGENPTERAASRNGLRPQPGLANLPELLDSLPAIGKQVTHQVEGTPRDLDPSVDLAAYRIVQEGLTNILRHAGERASPQLRLVWQADTLLIQIDNGTNLAKAHRAEATSGGRGLVGLHERVHAVGGHLEAGPHRGAGYRLTATLPLATQPGVPLSTMPRISGQDHGD
ncbi:MAG: sensor histidine kinase [Pseudonocardiaceae bacterium]